MHVSEDDRERALDMQVHLAGLSPPKTCIILVMALAESIAAAGGLLVALCLSAGGFGPLDACFLLLPFSLPHVVGRTLRLPFRLDHICLML